MYRLKQDLMRNKEEALLYFVLLEFMLSTAISVNALFFNEGKSVWEWILNEC